MTNSLIKVTFITFLKKFEMCVCKTLFKKPFLQKKIFPPPVFKKFGGAKNLFIFSFVF